MRLRIILSSQKVGKAVRPGLDQQDPGAWGDGTAATNKPFAFTGASVFTVKDGKITAQSDYYDALGFYKQLGLM